MTIQSLSSNNQDVSDLAWKVTSVQGELSSTMTSQSSLTSQISETQQSIVIVNREKENLQKILFSLKQEL